MTQTPYKFQVMSGMDGYMPNYHGGPYYAATRKEFAEILRCELDLLNYPANRFTNFNVRRMWRFIQSAGSGSSCHASCIDHNSERMEVCGLTDAEFDEMEANQDW